MKKINKLPLLKDDDGFTIIETLFATVVFSLLLLVLSSAMISISDTYYKGTTISTTQATARNIVNNISQAIEFDGNNINPTGSLPTPDLIAPPANFCVDNQDYGYQLGYEVNPALTSAPNNQTYQTYHSLVVKTSTDCDTNFQLNSSAAINGQDLVGPHMRLVALSVKAFNPFLQMAGDLWQVQVKVVYGDSDLLCLPSLSPTVAGGCAPSAPIIPRADLNNPAIACKGGPGDQFCAVSSLGTMVESRVQ